MSVKLNGAQYKAFWTSDWGFKEGYYIDDLAVSVNGVRMFDDVNEEDIKDTDKIVVEYGIIYYDGEDGKHLNTDAVPVIRKWLKDQKTATLIVEVRKEDLEGFKLFLEAFPSAKIKV
jgi:hypothetical protein